MQTVNEKVKRKYSQKFSKYYFFLFSHKDLFIHYEQYYLSGVVECQISVWSWRLQGISAGDILF